MRLILDMGSGASLPNVETARKMIEEVAKRDTKKHEIIFKAQLFESAPPNIRLGWDVFNAAHTYARDLGYQCTASVFDSVSLSFLLWHEIPFVKIACRPDLYWLAGEVPRKVPIHISCGSDWDIQDVPSTTFDAVWFDCVRKYPAESQDYDWSDLVWVSDHTIGWGLLGKAQHPQVWEKHLKLPDTTGPDAGPWAVTPQEWEGII